MFFVEYWLNILLNLVHLPLIHLILQIRLAAYLIYQNFDDVIQTIYCVNFVKGIKNWILKHLIDEISFQVQFIVYISVSFIISVNINLSVCEILFGIMNFSYGECNVFLCNEFDNIAWKMVPE